MKKRLFLNSVLRTGAALLILVTLSLATASPALAELDLNPANYFKFNFQPTAFDKSTVSAGEVFHAVIKGSADCTQDLPLSITEISIKSRVVARPVSGGADLLLNPEYVLNINPLPNKAGESFEINQAVNLQFPAGATPGNYVIIALLTEAKVTVKVLISYTLDVTDSFPAETLMGAVRCAVPSTAPATTTPAAGTVTPVTAPAITIPPATTLTPGGSNTATTESFPLTTIIIIGLIVVIVILLIIVIILLRGRGN